MIDRFRLFCLFNPCFILALVLVGAMAVCWEPRRVEIPLDTDRTAEVVGRLCRPPQVLENCLYLELEPISVHQQGAEILYPGRIALWMYSSRAPPETFFDPALTYGEIVRFSSTLELPPPILQFPASPTAGTFSGSRDCFTKPGSSRHCSFTARASGKATPCWACCTPIQIGLKAFVERTLMEFS